MLMRDPRPTLEAPDDDLYLWLEDIDGERSLAWVETQNAATLARFGDACFAGDRDTLAAIFDRPDNIPLIARRGTEVFNFWKDASHPRGLWRATTLDSYRSEQPEWDILLDLDALAAREDEDWTWSGASTLPGTPTLIPYSRKLGSLSSFRSDPPLACGFALIRRCPSGASALSSGRSRPPASNSSSGR